MRLSELYTSVQGEGPRVGLPVQFMRFAGCNLKCPSWPCDTQHAIDPVYRKEWEKITPLELADRVCEWPKRIVYTGGEPFLQQGHELLELTQVLVSAGYTIEAFTNGTLLWPEWTRGRVDMVMDWKLPGSGETKIPSASNLMHLRPTDSIKFTIASYDDFMSAREYWAKYQVMAKLATVSESELDLPRVFCGVVWGKVENADLVEWMLKAELPWTLNVQVHNYIWPRDQRGT